MPSGQSPNTCRVPQANKNQISKSDDSVSLKSTEDSGVGSTYFGPEAAQTKAVMDLFSVCFLSFPPHWGHPS